ncbi:MAG: hypothetical protein Q8L15_21850, partial [Methylobacter sp.]|nr:hypothetical protein [Methylobacter sp.]
FHWFLNIRQMPELHPNVHYRKARQQSFRSSAIAPASLKAPTVGALPPASMQAKLPLLLTPLAYIPVGKKNAAY